MLLPIVSFGQSKEAEDKFKSIESIVKESLEFISGTSDHAGDWEYYRSIFDANARFAILKQGKGEVQYLSFPLEDFVRRGKAVYNDGKMVERELHKTVNNWNGIAQVFQSYEVVIGDKKETGINSYELYNDGTRWWITSVVWTSDSNGTPLPKAYLGE